MPLKVTAMDEVKRGIKRHFVRIRNPGGRGVDLNVFCPQHAEHLANSIALYATSLYNVDRKKGD